MDDPGRDRTIGLKNGRRLGYAEFGDPAGWPLVGLHGTPGSRFMLKIADLPARRLGIRLIAPDRPGFGLSDPDPDRRYPDFARDVEALADALEIERFAVAGISGGGPYTLTCAALLPERVTQALVVSGVGPVVGPDATPGLKRGHRIMFRFGAKAPRLLRELTRQGERALRRDPDKVYERIRAYARPADQAIMARPEVRRTLISAFQEAFRQGGDGVATEIALFGRPWGFTLDQIAVPVRLWHGERDRLVPVAMGRHIAARLPECRASFVPDAGHYWVFDHIAALLEAATERI